MHERHHGLWWHFCEWAEFFRAYRPRLSNAAICEAYEQRFGNPFLNPFP